jgi:hypothetical protein
MPDLQVTVVLPYYLRLDAGDYQTVQAGEVIQVLAPMLDEATPPRSVLRAQFSPEDSTDPDVIQRLRARCAEQFLTRINRLLRWYRAVSRRADITELTRAQVSPFHFAAVGVALPPEWISPLPYEQPPPPIQLDAADTTAAVRAGLGTGRDPDVAELFLLDAQRALHQGRFRETVLFCWSTIDSVFNRKYDALIDVALAGEWAAAREFFTGVDFGVKNKMTAALYLLTHRSLFREPGDFWQSLMGSYNKRNGIIHRGENANEDEAWQAIEVAQRVVAIMNEIAVPGPGGVPPIVAVPEAPPLDAPPPPEAVPPEAAAPAPAPPSPAEAGGAGAVGRRRRSPRRRTPPQES